MLLYLHTISHAAVAFVGCLLLVVTLRHAVVEGLQQKFHDLVELGLRAYMLRLGLVAR